MFYSISTIEYIVMFNPKKTASTIILLLFLSFSATSFLVFPANATEDSWTTMEPMPTARNGFGVAVVDGKIYAIGGITTGTEVVDNNEVYDPLTDTWETKKSVPSIVESFGIAVCNNRIHVIGGGSGFSVAPHEAFHVVYDPATDTWESKTAMPTPRKRMDANVVNGKIYVIGGLTTNYSGDTTSVTEVYDPATDTWTRGTPIPTPAYSYASAVLDNKIYVIGRYTQIYDTETDTWSYGATLPTNVTSAAAGATTGVFAPKRIYVFGGITGYGPVEPNYINLTQVYDPETDTWTAAAAMRDSRAGVAVAVIDDELFVIGGSSLYTYFAVNEKYTPIGYIPEFPSWVILPLLFVATLMVIICKKRLPKNPSNI